MVARELRHFVRNATRNSKGSRELQRSLTQGGVNRGRFTSSRYVQLVRELRAAAPASTGYINTLLLVFAGLFHSNI